MRGAPGSRLAPWGDRRWGKPRWVSSDLLAGVRQAWKKRKRREPGDGMGGFQFPKGGSLTMGLT